MKMKGIDVSENNGAIDWQAVKNEGIEFVIIRCSYGLHSKDGNFAENVAGAHEVGLKVGAYHYSYALTVDDAIQEAVNCREAIDSTGVGIELPVFFDMEDADQYKANHSFSFSTEDITAICKAFIDNLGLDCGVYASYSWLMDKIDWQSFGCAIWNAQYNAEDDFKGYMWQYTDHEVIDGKNFDGNILY